MVSQLHTASLAIIVVFEIFASIFCLGRLASRFISIRAESWRGLMMWSDICMLIAWALSVGETVTMYKVTQLAHFGYKLVDAEKMPYNYREYSLVSFVNTLFYNPVLGLVKASMILLYLRLGGTKKGVRMGCYVLLFVVFGHAFGTTVADLLQCLPIRYNWDRPAMDLAAQNAVGANQPGLLPNRIPWPTGFKNGVYVTGGECFNLEYFLLITSGLSIFTDLLMLLIPIYMVYDLQLTPKKKVVVLIVLCMGLSVTAVGAARFQILYSGYQPNPNKDINFSIRSTISQIETDLALVTGCIPDLFPLVRRCFPNFLRSEPRVLPPNPYPYDSGSNSGLRNSTVSDSRRSSYSRRVKKILTPNTSKNMESIDEEMDIGHGMETFNWRGDNVRGAEVEVKGGADVEVFTVSEGADIDDVMGGNVNAIVKTTQFTVEEQDADSVYEHKWSNV
ncbi:uncharacterized protein LY89DRAFT_780008 [Mollisia scopiformis]|uniref:Rhodopsin domain-containing protein n=1 Tax=Mollisia scopiformis TaxID=149040 RepID=A0A194XJ71_MOLSC|nr:uncharacterized protein LY89DRAFT_780008 [Mollisia scopiformis]KUJ20171.1 hypothetical protein LY89DRAFT_780008 [Mollisia scopiformis]